MEDDRFDDRLVFSDEATFHIKAKVNKHNTRIWGTMEDNTRIAYGVTSSAPKLE